MRERVDHPLEDCLLGLQIAPPVDPSRDASHERHVVKVELGGKPLPKRHHEKSAPYSA